MINIVQNSLVLKKDIKKINDKVVYLCNLLQNLFQECLEAYFEKCSDRKLIINLLTIIMNKMNSLYQATHANAILINYLVTHLY